MTVWSCIRGYLDCFWLVLWHVKGMLANFMAGLRGRLAGFSG